MGFPEGKRSSRILTYYYTRVIGEWNRTCIILPSGKPSSFRKYGLGPLIGKRTWGGVVGIRGGHEGLVDGGYLNVPEFGNYGAEGEWIIENHGVEPDIEIDNLPADVLAGRDPQLERGIAEVLRKIDEKKPAFPPRPPSKDLRSPREREKGRKF